MPPKKTSKKGTKKASTKPPVRVLQEYKKPLPSGVNPLMNPKMDPALVRQMVTSFLRPSQMTKFNETSKTHHKDTVKGLETRKLDLNEAFQKFNQYLTKTVKQEFKTERGYQSKVWDDIHDKLHKLVIATSKSNGIRFRMKNGHTPFYNIVQTYKHLREAHPQQYRQHFVSEEPRQALYYFEWNGYNVNDDPDIFRLYLETGLNIEDLLESDFIPKEEDLILFLQNPENEYFNIGLLETLLKEIEFNKKKRVYNFNYRYLTKEGKTIAEILFGEMIVPFFTEPGVDLEQFKVTYAEFTKILKKLAKHTLGQ
jgi:hypothetical protein